MRARRGKETRGHCGDVCATRPEATILTDVLTIELKRGYTRCTLGELLDKPAGAAQTGYEEWYQQAHEAAERAKSFAWAIIHRRNKRVATITVPWRLMEALRKLDCFKVTPLPFMVFHARMRLHTKEGDRLLVTKLAAMTLEHWFKVVKPKHIRMLWKLV